MSLAQIAGLCAGATFLSACVPSMGDMRSSGSNKVVLSSTKAPEQLAGCISSAWSSGDALPASTQRTEAGWTVHYTVNNTTLALVDILPQGKGSVATYVSPYNAGSKGLYLPKVQACA
ncbi:hypothetical protein ACYQOP_00405 [Methylobacterium sp. CM6247]